MRAPMRVRSIVALKIVQNSISLFHFLNTSQYCLLTSQLNVRASRKTELLESAAEFLANSLNINK